MKGRKIMDITYTVIRSDRKTVGIQIHPGGKVIVRAPRKLPQRAIQELVKEKEAWILAHLEAQKRREEAAEAERDTAGGSMLSAEQLQELADQAVKVIPERVRLYAPQVGVTYGRITIRNQRTRWGSCSSKGNLNFNCLLMLAPMEVLDSVVVHELCHRKEMNHSKRFYEEVYRVFPEYDKWNQWLKQHGQELMSRM